MHLVFRESHGLEEQAVPQDLGQRPGDVVVLSFSDSDLSAFAAGWRAGEFPWSLRLANLAALVHPLSVDTYVEQTLVHAKAILIRLIGGRPYWAYGLQQVELLARARGIEGEATPMHEWRLKTLDGVEHHQAGHERGELSVASVSQFLGVGVEQQPCHIALGDL